MDLTQRLRSGVQQLGLTVSEAQIDQLLLFVQLLQKWNKAYNLTAIAEPQEIISKHILDSLSVLEHLRGEYILDIGSGAGLPGIPLAIMCPEKIFTLLDSNAKKTRFIQQVSIELGLKNAQVVQQRVEQYSPNQTIDTLVSRAYASSSKLLAACERMLENLDEEGRIIFMLGKQKQLEALPKRYNVRGIFSVNIPQLEAQRHIAIVEKI